MLELIMRITMEQKHLVSEKLRPIYNIFSHEAFMMKVFSKIKVLSKIKAKLNFKASGSVSELQWGINDRPMKVVCFQRSGKDFGPTLSVTKLEIAR